jgi:hypothetical protein
MGLFGKAIDARTSQVLRNELGFDVEFDFVAGGVFKCDPLSFSIKPFIAAINDEAIFFIHEGRVALVLPWSGILRRKPDIWGKGSELLIYVSKTSKVSHPQEFPFCFWHKAEISFNKPEDHAKFLQMYMDHKLANGFTEQTLQLHDEWLKCGIGLPVSQEKYMKANEGWGTEESRLDSYKIWGLTQDAQRFLYFVGRSVCQGLLPEQLIERALEIWLETEKISSKYTGSISTPNDAFVTLMETTKALSNYDGDSQAWAIGRLEVGESEWKSEIPTFERLVAFDLRNTNGNFSIVPIWSDFHGGTDLVIAGILKSGPKESLNLSTSKGLATITGDERSKFARIVEKYSS